MKVQPYRDYKYPKQVDGILNRSSHSYPFYELLSQLVVKNFKVWTAGWTHRQTRQTRARSIDRARDTVLFKCGENSAHYQTVSQGRHS